MKEQREGREKHNDDDGEESVISGNDNKERVDRLTGAESFLVGLSPNYWAHIPLSIADINNLRLMDGIDCMVVSSSPKISDKEKKYIPISKCLLTGIIVSIHPRYDESIIYLLDDGTGLMDCLKWGSDDEYQLPSLVSPFSAAGIQQQSKYEIGDLVQIWGKIRIVRVMKTDDDDDNGGNECVREVHVIRMESAAKKELITTTTTTHYYDTSWQRETRHIQRLCDYWCKKPSCNQESSATSNFQNNIAGNTNNVITPRNAVDVLSILGPTLTRQVLDRMEWPSPREDNAASWRIFGPSCQCILSKNNLKQELLYCPCLATIEPMDPDWKFREALLCHLLEEEERSSPDPKKQPFCFEYQSILNNETLQDKIGGGGGGGASYPTLVLKTVAALRNDGILFLIDRDTDMYLLITRSRVLEPMLLARKKRKRVKKDTITHYERLWKFVPMVRLQYVQSCWKQQQQKEQRK